MHKQFTFVDLTHTITTSIPAWQGTDSFSTNIIRDYHQGHRTQQFNIGSNTGTHLDAPAHFDQSKPMIDDIPLDKLIVPACVIDVSSKCAEECRISADDVAAFDRCAANGVVRQRALAGQAGAHQHADQVVNPVPGYGDDQERQKQQHGMGAGNTHAGQLFADAGRVQRAFDTSEQSQVIQRKAEDHDQHGKTEPDQTLLQKISAFPPAFEEGFLIVKL